MLWISIAIFLLVAGLVTYASWKFRARNGRTVDDVARDCGLSQATIYVGCATWENAAVF
jgi:heme/copper-type cytochrome/quinol oxidase subunit 2